MPVPILPPELIINIVEHLQLSYDDEEKEEDVSEVVEIGKALSLVCRDWRSIGQELRWRFLVVDPSSFRSLLLHFRSHPQLPLLLRRFDQAIKQKIPTNEEQRRQWWEPLPELLSLAPKLEVLGLGGQFGANNLEILQVASHLPFLNTLWFRSCDLVWTSSMELLWIDGFHLLKNLEFWMERVEIRSKFFCPVQPRLKEVEILDLKCFEANENMLPVIQFLLSMMDPSRVEQCFLSETAACPTVFSWLQRSSRLDWLSVEVYPSDFPRMFFDLVQLLPGKKTLENVVIRVIEDDEGNLRTVNSTISIQQLLSSLPPNLSLVEAHQIAFSDLDTIQWSESSEPPLSSVCLETLTPRPLGDGYRHMTVWRDLDTDSKWYKTLDEEEDESELGSDGMSDFPTYRRFS
jgi:hypothetical protein